MKKIIVSFFIALLIISSNAQVNFEGTIKWNLSLNNSKNTGTTTQKELTPQQKADLNKGIAELESKLNDPSMQAMFESNPSMKAMLEQQVATMKAMQGENGVSGLIPKSYTVKMKDGNSYTQMEGGAMAAAGDILYLKLTDKTYYIKKAAKTYSVAPKSKSATSEDATTTVTATTETAKILNYTCTKYIVTLTEVGKTKTLFIWATKDLKQYTSSSFHTSGIGNQGNMAALKKIDGVPLKIEVTEQGQTVVLEVIELKNVTLSAADFVLPADYKEVPFGQ
jgi:hypothetical protein